MYIYNNHNQVKSQNFRKRPETVGPKDKGEKMLEKENTHAMLIQHEYQKSKQRERICNTSTKLTRIAHHRTTGRVHVTGRVRVHM